MTKIITISSNKDPLKYINALEDSETDGIVPKRMRMFYRQGDILFKKVENLPQSALLNEKSDNVVAEGELTGHSHVVVNGAVYELLNSDHLYIKANDHTKIVHNEHLPIKLETGNYQVIRQREYLGRGSGKVITKRVID